jgi:hypothetical protein
MSVRTGNTGIILPLFECIDLAIKFLDIFVLDLRRLGSQRTKAVGEVGLGFLHRHDRERIMLRSSFHPCGGCSPWDKASTSSGGV